MLRKLWDEAAPAIRMIVCLFVFYELVSVFLSCNQSKIYEDIENLWFDHLSSVRRSNKESDISRFQAQGNFTNPAVQFKPSYAQGRKETAPLTGYGAVRIATPASLTDNEKVDEMVLEKLSTDRGLRIRRFHEMIEARFGIHLVPFIRGVLPLCEGIPHKTKTKIRVLGTQSVF